jgi:hypothetical protein
MRLLDFSINLIHSDALWPWIRLGLLAEMSTRNLSGVKPCGYPRHVARIAFCYGDSVTFYFFFTSEKFSEIDLK